MIKEHST